MSLFLITVKSRLAANLTLMEKGMKVEVLFLDSELYANGCPDIIGSIYAQIWYRLDEIMRS